MQVLYRSISMQCYFMVLIGVNCVGVHNFGFKPTDAIL